MFNIKGSINSVVIGNCDTAWEAGMTDFNILIMHLLGDMLLI
jgi:hypothetical protein